MPWATPAAIALAPILAGIFANNSGGGQPPTVGPQAPRDVQGLRTNLTNWLQQSMSRPPTTQGQIFGQNAPYTQTGAAAGGQGMQGPQGWLGGPSGTSGGPNSPAGGGMPPLFPTGGSGAGTAGPNPNGPLSGGNNPWVAPNNPAPGPYTPAPGGPTMVPNSGVLFGGTGPTSGPPPGMGAPSAAGGGQQPLNAGGGVGGFGNHPANWVPSPAPQGGGVPPGMAYQGGPQAGQGGVYNGPTMTNPQTPAGAPNGMWTADPNAPGGFRFVPQPSTGLIAMQGALMNPDGTFAGPPPRPTAYQGPTALTPYLPGGTGGPTPGNAAMSPNANLLNQPGATSTTAASQNVSGQTPPGYWDGVQWVPEGPPPPPDSFFPGGPDTSGPSVPPGQPGYQGGPQGPQVPAPPPGWTDTPGPIGNGSSFNNMYYTPSTAAGSTLNPFSSAAAGPGTQSVDQLGGANSAFFQNMMGQLAPAFNMRRDLGLAAAKESAGNLTGSGFGNILGSSINRSLGEEQAALANYATMGLQQEMQRQMGMSQLGQQNNQFNAGAQNQYGLNQANLYQQANLANAGFANQAAGQNANSFLQSLLGMATGGVGQPAIGQQTSGWGAAGNWFAQMLPYILGMGGGGGGNSGGSYNPYGPGGY